MPRSLAKWTPKPLISSVECPISSEVFSGLGKAMAAGLAAGEATVAGAIWVTGEPAAVAAGAAAGAVWAAAPGLGASVGFGAAAGAVVGAGAGLAAGEQADAASRAARPAITSRRV